MLPKSTPRSGAVLRGLAILWLGLLAGFAIGIEWIRSRPIVPPPSGAIDLVGAGATFPYPLYRRWFAEYGAASGIRINYFSVGSAEGIRLMLADSVDFGASDRLLTPEESAAARCGPVTVPTVVGAIAVAYNLPGLTAPLQLDADVVAGMLLGRIRRWDAPQLRALNPGVALPALAILPARRARPTGTSAVFASYLEQSAAWRAASPAERARTNAGARVEGNEGVTAEVQIHEGAVGIVELAYALQARLAVARLRNTSGAFVLPTVESTAAAADELLTPAGADTLTGIVGARAPAAYPVAALTRIIADGALRDTSRAAHFLAFARWTLVDGARTASEAAYAPLPEGVRARQLRRLDAITPGHCPSGGTP